MKLAPTLADALLRESFHPAWRRLDPQATFRNTLLQARRFVLDETMSAFMADLAYSSLGKFRNPARLRWRTHHQNCIEKIKHGTTSRGQLVPSIQGEKHWKAILTKKEVLKIRRLSKTTTLASIAKKYNVSNGTIYDIVHRKTWAWL